MRSNAPIPHHSGFTLIELMIVVVVIAILSMVAYPAYTTYMQRGKIGEATSTLSSLRMQLEQFYQDNRTYGATSTGSTGAVSYCGSSTNKIPASSSPPGTQYFTYTCAASPDSTLTNAAGGTDQTFVLTATGTSAMAGYTYTVDHMGNRQTTAFPGVSGTKNCWLLKSGDC